MAQRKIRELGLLLTAPDLEPGSRLGAHQEGESLLKLTGTNFGCSGRAIPKVIAFHPLPVPFENARAWELHSKGKHQSWAWHGTRTLCADGTCLQPGCNLCSIAKNGFQTQRCDSNNKVCQNVGDVTFFAFAAAHAAVFAEHSEVVTGRSGRRIIILSRVVTGLDIADKRKFDALAGSGRKSGREPDWAGILKDRSSERCWLGGQLPSGSGINVLLSWNNANILPLYAVEVEAVEPFKTRIELANGEWRGDTIRLKEVRMIPLTQLVLHFQLMRQLVYSTITKCSSSVCRRAWVSHAPKRPRATDKMPDA
jgi:hypothetical protein